MPDPVIVSTPPPTVTKEPVQPEPATFLPPASDGTAISQNEGGSILMPTVVVNHPPVAGEKIPDRGDEAAYVVLHRRFGEFPQGSRLSMADIVNPKDIPALLEIGAIAELPKVEAAPAASDPAPEPEATPAATKKSGK